MAALLPDSIITEDGRIISYVSDSDTRRTSDVEYVPGAPPRDIRITIPESYQPQGETEPTGLADYEDITPANEQKLIRQCAIDRLGWKLPASLIGGVIGTIALAGYKAKKTKSKLGAMDVGLAGLIATGFFSSYIYQKAKEKCILEEVPSQELQGLERIVQKNSLGCSTCQRNQK